jgi:hypothetical protein
MPGLEDFETIQNLGRGHFARVDKVGGGFVCIRETPSHDLCASAVWEC